ncbi:MAG TPA: hypothetical protein VIV57_18710 [Anaeromyxobacter sp.]
MAGVLVMLNNYFHDLSVALLTCALAAVAVVWRAAPLRGPEARPLAEALDRAALRVASASLVGVVVFGAVRAWAFMDYEWLPAGGRGIVPALVVKHVVLVTLLGAAGIAAWRARRRARTAAAERS